MESSNEEPVIILFVGMIVVRGGHKKPSTEHRTELTETETEYTETEMTENNFGA
jgi:hypothetical protein